MTFGLTPEAIELLRNIFRKHPEVSKVQVFGSRALGKERINSDIDLVLWGNVDRLLLAKIAAELDELPLPYLFDIKWYEEITHPGLREHIKKFGKDL